MNVNSAEVIFDLAEQQAPKILLVGVGGCGCSAVAAVLWRLWRKRLFWIRSHWQR